MVIGRLMGQQIIRRRAVESRDWYADLIVSRQEVIWYQNAFLELSAGVNAGGDEP
jgi:hypothetical protein